VGGAFRHAVRHLGLALADALRAGALFAALAFRMLCFGALIVGPIWHQSWSDHR
jgi:hypothetical protein